MERSQSDASAQSAVPPPPPPPECESPTGTNDSALREAYDNLRVQSDQQLELMEELEEELRIAAQEREDALAARDKVTAELEEARGDYRELSCRRDAEEATFTERKRNFDHIITVFAEEKKQFQERIEALEEEVTRLRDVTPEIEANRVEELERDLANSRREAEESAEAMTQLKAQLEKKEQEASELHAVITRKRKQWDTWREECHERIKAEAQTGRDLEQRLREKEEELELCQSELTQLRTNSTQGSEAVEGGGASQEVQDDSLVMSMLEEREIEIERRVVELKQVGVELEEVRQEKTALAAILEKERITSLKTQADASAEATKYKEEVQRLRRIVFRLESAASNRQQPPLSPGRGLSPRKTKQKPQAQPHAAPLASPRPLGSRQSQGKRSTPQRVPSPRKHVGVPRTASPSPRLPQPIVRPAAGTRHNTPPRFIPAHLGPLRRSPTPVKLRAEASPRPSARPPSSGAKAHAATAPLKDRTVNV